MDHEILRTPLVEDNNGTTRTFSLTPEDIGKISLMLQTEKIYGFSDLVKAIGTINDEPQEGRARYVLRTNYGKFQDAMRNVPGFLLHESDKNHRWTLFELLFIAMFDEVDNIFYEKSEYCPVFLKGEYLDYSMRMLFAIMMFLRQETRKVWLVNTVDYHGVRHMDLYENSYSIDMESCRKVKVIAVHRIINLYLKRLGLDVFSIPQEKGTAVEMSDVEYELIRAIRDPKTESNSINIRHSNKMLRDFEFGLNDAANEKYVRDLKGGTISIHDDTSRSVKVKFRKHVSIAVLAREC